MRTHIYAPMLCNHAYLHAHVQHPAGGYKNEKDAVKDPRRRTAQEKEKIQQQVGM